MSHCMHAYNTISDSQIVNAMLEDEEFALALLLEIALRFDPDAIEDEASELNRDDAEALYRFGHGLCAIFERTFK